MTEQDVLLTVNEVIQRLRISRSTLLRLEEAGKIPKHMKVGRRRLYRSSDIANFIATGQ